MSRAVIGLLIVFALAIFARVLPHLPNSTPIMALCIFAGWHYRLSMALLFTLMSLLISDLLLAWMHHTAFLGVWSLFTYSGFLWVTIAAHKMQTSSQYQFIFISSIVYWVWTNFGVWLSAYYSHDLSGLMACYTLALPFLGYSLLGNLVWLILFDAFFCVFLIRLKNHHLSFRSIIHSLAFYPFSTKTYTFNHTLPTDNI